ncbi:MAG: glycosyltransferase [Holosporaceae bacterium]|jgi:glycosyltransferase involved in cell wall biosynthesis|nr:glycosyltransferase [Holosporaceae bacterium]
MSGMRNNISLVNFPKVTVVTVVRNLIETGRESFFLQCIESVREQTYPNIEHIVIDGASTDGTLDLLKKYADKGWIVYYSEQDNGIYDAMNKGIQKSTGKYINFLNSDDYFCDRYGLERSVELLEDSGAVFSYSRVYFVCNEEKIALLPDKIERFFFSMPFCHQGVLMRRDAIVNEGMFDVKLNIVCDYDLLVKLIMKGCECVSVDVIFVAFRTGGYAYESVKQADIEYQKIQKKYFSELENTKKRDEGNCHFEYYITKDQLESIKSCVSEEISQKISKLKMEKLLDGRLKIKSGAYFDFLAKRYYLFGIPILTIKQRKLLNSKSEKIWMLFNIKVFRIKKLKYYKCYYFMYIPVFVVARDFRLW